MAVLEPPEWPGRRLSPWDGELKDGGVPLKLGSEWGWFGERWGELWAHGSSWNHAFPKASLLWSSSGYVTSKGLFIDRVGISKEHHGANRYGVIPQDGGKLFCGWAPARRKGLWTEKRGLCGSASAPGAGDLTACLPQLIANY